MKNNNGLSSIFMQKRQPLILFVIFIIILISSSILIYKIFEQKGKSDKVAQTLNSASNSVSRSLGEKPTPAEQKRIAKITLPQATTIEQTQKIVEEWIKNQPTYKFDGQNLTLKDAKELANDFYRFLYDFETKHAGYGNRSRQQLEEKVTSHLLEITAQNSRVLYALIDGRWDEVEQKATR